jgi:hypothetical protein
MSSPILLCRLGIQEKLRCPFDRGVLEHRAGWLELVHETKYKHCTSPFNLADNHRDVAAAFISL